MRINPRKKYIDKYDGTIKTGAQWLKTIKQNAVDLKDDWGCESSIDDLFKWELATYTGEIESDHLLTPVHK